jgi:hypothetical protein
MEARLKKTLESILPNLTASLDCVCVVDKSNHIVHMNLAMKSFLGLRGGRSSKTPVFCDVLKLVACEKGCQILDAIDTGNTGNTLRLDEAPATRGDAKLRVLVKVIPLHDVDEKVPSEPVGAMITLRDTTGEVILQAKYHKTMQLLSEKDSKIRALDDKITDLQAALRRARTSRAA